jgi:hypothetical protein
MKHGLTADVSTQDETADELRFTQIKPNLCGKNLTQSRKEAKAQGF